MKEIPPLLMKCPLFARIDPADLPHLLSCLKAQQLHVPKGGHILTQGDPARFFGVLLSGRAQIIRGDMQGSHTVTAAVHPGDLFAEALICAGEEFLPVNVIATEECVVLLIEHNRLIHACQKGCMSHSLLVTSLLRILSQKTLLLNQKLEIVTRRTTREKLMAYLQTQSTHANSRRFIIPFDRQGLADYLGVERSAMSTELGKLKKAGLIDFRKNEFELLDSFPLA